MIPSSAELRYFVEVASTLNISRAAERLGISQPTLSLAVKRLEDSFGVPLLIRGKSGVRLTNGGQKLVSRARALLDEWEKIRGEAISDEAEIGGRYTIGCHPTVALYTLPAILPGLLKAHPGIELRLVHDLSRWVTEDVVSFKVDFGIVVNPVPHPDLVIRPLYKDEIGFWAGPAGGNEDVLICDPDLLQTQAIFKQLARRGVTFRRTITSGNLEIIAALVAAGAGVGMLPGCAATRVRELKLKPYGTNLPTYSDRICLVYRADTQRSRTSRLLAQAIPKALEKR
jgi:DNA-binding transcriptional LysR family regulator